MTNAKIRTVYNKIISHLNEKRLKEALGETAGLLSDLSGEWSLSDKLSELETSYRYMIRYMLDGMDDPNRHTFYDQLLLSAYNLADRAAESLLEKESSQLYFQKKRYYKLYPDQTIQAALDEVDKAINDLSLNNLLSDIENNTEMASALRKKKKRPKGNCFSASGATIQPRSGTILPSKRACRRHDFPARQPFSL